MTDHVEVCFTTACRSRDVTTRVEWTEFAPCPYGTTWHCAEHAGKFREKRDKPWNCTICKHEGRKEHPIRILSITELTSYDRARIAWLRDGYLADKDKLVAAVTLTDPVNWDIYGSIMAADEPAPVPAVPRRNWPTMAPAVIAVLAVLLIAAFILGGLLL